jgi:hypothetical protein
MSHLLITPFFGLLDVFIFLLAVFIGFMFNNTPPTVILVVSLVYAGFWVVLFLFEEGVREENDLYNMGGKR